MRTAAELETERVELLSLLERIGSSHGFARSPRLRELLLFIGERALAGRSAELTEIEIARHVFGRGDDFVPFEDSIVRSTARQLRLKLKEYFDAHPEAWKLEVPKGSYVPVFTRVAAEPEAAAPPSPPVPVAAPTSRPARLRVLLTANVVLVAACGALLLDRSRPATPPPPPPTLLSEFLRQSSGTIPVVASDFSLAAMRYVLGSGKEPPEPLAISLEEYARFDYGALQPKPEASPQIHRAFDLLRTHRLTRSGDLVLSARIAEAGVGSGKKIVVRHARDVAARDLRSSFCVILGNPNSTPWTAPFEERLRFRWVVGVGYRDAGAAPGDRAVWQNSRNTYSESGAGVGRLALIRNVTGEGRVLLISGVNMVTMEAVGEVVLDPSKWQQLAAALRIDPARPIPDFEALLETEAIDHAPMRAQFVRIRRLEP